METCSEKFCTCEAELDIEGRRVCKSCHFMIINNMEIELDEIQGK